MSDERAPVIVGAGPVGLGAALFLARQGRPPRVVERRSEPTPQSRALAVNPRTLEILAPTGVTRQMLERGKPIRAACLHRGASTIATIPLEGAHPTYPFMLALSQSSTERLLQRALEEAGGAVERGVELVECRAGSDGIESALTTDAAGPGREVVRPPWMLAADGAHSLIRHQLGIAFDGTTFAEEWHLADAPLRTPLAEDQAHVIFLDGGAFLFLLRVIDEELEGTREAPIWRVIGNRPDPLSMVPGSEPAGDPVWSSSFRIAHRLVATMAKDGVYFAGDAAHVHSPVGARGMNLGLEDAWILSELARTGRLSEYDALRRPVDRGVVRRVERISRIVSAESWLDRMIRDHVFPTAIELSPVRAQMRKTVMGLDHALPEEFRPAS